MYLPWMKHECNGACVADSLAAAEKRLHGAEMKVLAADGTHVRPKLPGGSPESDALSQRAGQGAKARQSHERAAYVTVRPVPPAFPAVSSLPVQHGDRSPTV